MEFGPYLMLASLEGAVTAAVLMLTALGLSLVFGVMRVVNVAHGEFFMLGAVLAWFIATTLGGHPAIGFVAALVIAPSNIAKSIDAQTELPKTGRPAFEKRKIIVLVPIFLAFALVSRLPLDRRRVPWCSRNRPEEFGDRG